MKYASNVLDLVGNTPCVRLNAISDEYNCEVFGKCEFLNPTHSVKDRIALSMIEDGINSGKINENTTIIEPTSGNTGIGLAMICATKKLKLILTMPESMSIERRKLLGAFGAKIVLTQGKLGMKGAISKAKDLISQTDNSFCPSQFENPANPRIHEETTAVEIINDLGEDVDIVIAGVGTGGTLSGIAKVLKEKNPNVIIVAVEPSDSSVISGGTPGPHKIQGIGAGFIPKNLNVGLVDKIVVVDNEDAFAMAKKLTKTEGLLIGISAGANVYATELMAKENPNKKIVTILCDTGERYLSTGLFD
ncbi:MAG: Cysteine synthase (EC [uncultured Campylobacterales bacterium]|uniref:Cysteine synthase n=1 Tax=uncultured Campylobacterales bacterium TaxID=352960 RepID=A0A6S6SEH9_9BACT|nr:MAG: Cysteine synthase (EC [uncultured Campylobacterales bacterium]